MRCFFFMKIGNPDFSPERMSYIEQKKQINVLRATESTPSQVQLES